MADEKFEAKVRLALIIYDGRPVGMKKLEGMEKALKGAGFAPPTIPPELFERLEKALKEYDNYDRYDNIGSSPEDFIAEVFSNARALLSAHQRNQEKGDR